MKNPMLALLGLLALIANPGQTDDAAWNIRHQEVPPPAAASEELRLAIAAAGPPDLTMPDIQPATSEEWRAVIEQYESFGAAERRALAEHLPITVERSRLAGVGVHYIRPTNVAKAHEDHLFLNLHGGAYFLGRGEAGLKEAMLIAARLGITVLSVDYRMPPEHPYPAALEDAVKVYRGLLKIRRPETIVLGGTSSGGGLALASIHRLKALGLPVPGALYAGTPWADLTRTGDTVHTNEGLDRILVGYGRILAAAAELYAGGHEITDPFISPVYGDFAGFPPTILISGTRDLFLSDVSRTHRKLREAGIKADLHVYEGLSHAEYLFVIDSPEAHDVYRELAAFVEMHLD